MQENGADCSKEHSIEFFLYSKDEETSELAKTRLKKMGFEVDIHKDEKDSAWLCLATKNLLPQYKELNRIRKRLERLAQRLNGEYDGWGTLI